MSLLLTTWFCIFGQAAVAQTPPEAQASTLQAQAAPVQSATSTPSCAQLTSDEQEFASQLSQGNKTLFCTQFTPAQRARSMDLAGQMGLDGNLITNDQAVERVAKEANIPVPASSASPNRQGSSCPATQKK